MSITKHSCIVFVFCFFFFCSTFKTNKKRKENTPQSNISGDTGGSVPGELARRLIRLRLAHQLMNVKPCANGRNFVSQQLPALLDVTCCVRVHTLLVSKVLWTLYPSHNALQVPTLLGVVTSVCTPLLTRTQQLPPLLVQQSWKL